jgi:hypothetical protein
MYHYLPETHSLELRSSYSETTRTSLFSELPPGTTTEMTFSLVLVLYADKLTLCFQIVEVHFFWELHRLLGESHGSMVKELGVTVNMTVVICLEVLFIITLSSSHIVSLFLH